VATGPFHDFGEWARNAVEVARFGGLDTGEESSPFEVTQRSPTHRLRRYFPDSEHHGPAVILIPPMMLSAEVFDVSPTVSAVAELHGAGIDAWVVDFGEPAHEEGGLQRGLQDHLDAISESIDHVGATTGGPPHLAGYSQGGMFAYEVAVFRGNKGIASIITLGSPVDLKAMKPAGIPLETLEPAAEFLSNRVIGTRSLPSWVSSSAFELLDPAGSLRKRVDFVRRLHDRDALSPKEKQRRFLRGEGWVAWPGPSLLDMMVGLTRHNRFMTGGYEIDGHLYTLADLDLPVLTVWGSLDAIAPPSSVRALGRAAPRCEVYEYDLPVGHFGLVAGSVAAADVWPVVAAWMLWRAGEANPPDAVSEWNPRYLDDPDPPAPGAVESLVRAGQLTADVVGVAGDTASKVMSDTRDLAIGALRQLPVLRRLNDASTMARISLGGVLAERARTHPNATAFLYEGRGHTYADMNRRVDAIVRGLIGAGVRHGTMVGLAMETRPSALTTIIALNRLGAITCILRPGVINPTELRLSGAELLVVDPEHVDAVRAEDAEIRVLVLGGGGDPRDLGAGITDLEQVDPDAVEIPKWYRPDPGLGGDLAFVLFSGQGDRVRARQITNERWALSAFGTAAAASLSRADTLYGVTPHFHPAGLLTTFGGALAGGARLVMSSGFDPEMFWPDIRRYGVTVVSYTWTMVKELLDAPVSELERGHSIRLFVGSGMPVGLWSEVHERFEPARVVEFYASTSGHAVLVNMGSGETRIGSCGQRLVGSPNLLLAATNPATGDLALTDDGMARRAEPGELGLLLSEAKPPHLSGVTHRSLRTRGDAWRSTDDLFTIDEDGYYWLADHKDSLILGRPRAVPPTQLERLLETHPLVRLAAVTPSSDGALVVATVIPTRSLTKKTIEDITSSITPGLRPDVVRVVKDLPITAWYRIDRTAIAATDPLEPKASVQIWRRNTADDTYNRIVRQKGKERR
jgi:putative long chain acyl-CoA synthase